MTATPAADDRPVPGAESRTARAKVNLCLHIVGRRPDGYHLVDGLTAFATLGDRIGVSESENGHFLQVSCSELPEKSAVVPADIRNLAWRAMAALHRRAARQGRARAIANTRRSGITISIEKRIPSGAGLGGGSADAAAVLRLLNERLVPPFSVETLAEIGLGLGADLPVCLAESCRRVQGIGEILSPVPGPVALPAVLIWPGLPTTTPAVFARRRGPFDRPLTEDDLALFRADPLAALTRLGNGLAGAAIDLAPVIEQAIEALTYDADCRLARMTGSGSAVFGLFTTRAAAARAAERIAAAERSWWVRPTVIGDREDRSGHG